MIRTLFTSSSGLRGHQELLDVVGNNLANVNTTAFKAQRLRFGTQFSETLRAATAPGTTGGTNPRQVGNGALTTAVDGDFNQGNLENTGNALDMAIEGEGFFVLNDGRQNLYTRSGAFSVDAEGLLIDAGTGMRVQRFGVLGEADPNDSTLPAFQTSGDNNVHIDFDRTSVPGKATTEVTLRGNLDAEAIGPRTEVIAINSPFTFGGVPATAATLLNNLDQTTAAYVNGDRIAITGTDMDGNSVSGVFIVANAATASLGNLLDSINAAFGTTSVNGVVTAGQNSPRGATASMDANGNIVLTANSSGPARLTLNLASNAPGEVAPATNATGITTFNNFVTVTEGKDGDTKTTAIQVFDDQGTAHTLTFTFQKQGNNTWDLISAIDPSGTFVGLDDYVKGITFNEDGSFQAITGTDAQHVITTTNAFTTTGLNGTQSALLTDSFALLDQSVGVVAGDTIQITGTAVDGTAVNSNYVITAAAGDVQGLITQLNTAFNSALPTGATATLEGGNIVLRANSAGPSQLSLSLAFQPTVSLTGTLDIDSFQQAVKGTDGDDSIVFEVTNLAGFSTQQTIQFRVGAVNSFEGLTQFGGFTSAAAVQQDGFAPGDLVDVAVSAEGILNGIFSNGNTHALAQLAVANFANNEGLFRVGSNLFREDLNSGQAVIGAAGANGTGSVQGSVLEASNVDVTLEFTRLITAQRGFQVNARAFTTADQVLQETVNLKQ